MLYPLSYEGGPAGSLPRRSASVGSAERDQGTVAAGWSAGGIVPAEPGGESRDRLRGH